MKVKGQSIPSDILEPYGESLQTATRRQAADTNLYNNEIYNETKYHTNMYVRLRYPWEIPHMQGA